MAGYDQPCRVRGTVRAGGREHAIDAPRPARPLVGRAGLGPDRARAHRDRVDGRRERVADRDPPGGRAPPRRRGDLGGAVGARAPARRSRTAASPPPTTPTATRAAPAWSCGRRATRSGRGARPARCSAAPRSTSARCGWTARSSAGTSRAGRASGATTSCAAPRRVIRGRRLGLRRRAHRAADARLRADPGGHGRARREAFGAALAARGGGRRRAQPALRARGRRDHRGASSSRRWSASWPSRSAGRSRCTASRERYMGALEPNARAHRPPARAARARAAAGAAARTTCASGSRCGGRSCPSTSCSRRSSTPAFVGRAQARPGDLRDRARAARAARGRVRVRRRPGAQRRRGARAGLRDGPLPRHRAGDRRPRPRARGSAVGRVRPERADEHAAIRAVHAAAFAPSEIEAPLLDALRADGDLIAALSLVAERGGDARGPRGDQPRVGRRRPRCSRSGPIGVLPAHQGAGRRRGAHARGARRGRGDGLPARRPARPRGLLPALRLRAGRAARARAASSRRRRRTGSRSGCPAYDPALRGEFRYADAFARGGVMLNRSRRRGSHHARRRRRRASCRSRAGPSSTARGIPRPAPRSGCATATAGPSPAPAPPPRRR